MNYTIIVNEGNGQVWEKTGALIDVLSDFAHAVAEGCGARVIWVENGCVNTADFVGSVCVGFHRVKGGNNGATKA